MNKIIANYENNSIDYDFIKIDDFDLILVKNGDNCDILNSDVETLVFKDCKKNFSDLCNIYFDFLVFNDDFKFIDNFEKIYLIKIILKGYDENHDKLTFDIKDLNLKSPYKYSITDKSIEINIDIEDDFLTVKHFFSTIRYKCFDIENKAILVYINGDLVYDNKI